MVRKTLPLSMPPEKQTPMGSCGGDAVEPEGDLVSEGGDVVLADDGGVAAGGWPWAG